MCAEMAWTRGSLLQGCQSQCQMMEASLTGSLQLVIAVLASDSFRAPVLLVKWGSQYPSTVTVLMTRLPIFQGAYEGRL